MMQDEDGLSEYDGVNFTKKMWCSVDVGVTIGGGERRQLALIVGQSP
jgi:hypothetical protein